MSAGPRLTDITIDVFLELAQQISGAVVEMAQTANRLLTETQYRLTDRDRVLIGLALKMESSFRCVMEDARAKRGEAMHHLKTMVESYLYFHLAVADPSETTTMQLLAEVCYQKQKFLADNPGYRRGSDGDGAWAEQLAEFERVGIQRIGKKGNLKDLVRDSAPLKEWYSAVYQAACEPAHIADLVDFLPDLDEPRIEIGSGPFPGVAARFAIDHGIAVMLDAIRVARDGNVIGLRVDALEGFQARYLEIRSGVHMRLDVPDRKGGSA